MCQNTDIETGKSQNIDLPQVSIDETEDFTITETKSNEPLQKNVNEEESKETASKGSLTRLFQFCIPERCMLFLGILLMLGAEATTQIIPLIVAKAYNTMIDNQNQSSSEDTMSQVDHYMLLSIVIFLVGTFANFIRGGIFAVVGERMVARLRNDVYGSILIQDIAFFDEHKSGDLVSRLGSDTTLLQNVISTSLPEAMVSMDCIQAW